MWSTHSDFGTLVTIDQVTVATFIADDFVGEESPATVGGLHLATATSITRMYGPEDRKREDDPGDGRGAFPPRPVPKVSAGP
jgi:hypothetical protein